MMHEQIKILRKRMEDDNPEEYIIHNSNFLFHNKEELIEFSDIKDDVLEE